MAKFLNQTCVLLLLLFLGLLPLRLTAQEESESSDPSPAKVAEPQDDSDDEKKEDDEDDDEEDGGQSDLDAAFDLKINAKSTRDLDGVADLCESAVEKGLDADAEKQARDLWSSVLFDHAKQLQRRIAPGGTLSTRWRWLRREAISRLNKSIEVSPGKVAPLILLAQLHGLNAGDREKAMEAIEKAIAQIKGDNEMLSNALFERSRLTDDEKTRIADLTQSVKINPKNVEALMQRAMIYLTNEKSDEAVADFKAALSVDKENTDRFLAVANELRRRSLFTEAVAILNDAVKVDPENTQLLLLRSRCLVGTENETAALKDLDAVIDAERQNVEARELRTRILIAESKFEEALADANELVQQKPDDSVGLELRSLVHQASGDFDKAIADTQALLDKDKENLNFKFNLAILHSANNQPSKSIPIFDQILRNVVEAGQPGILRNRADAYLSLGKHDRAIDDYEMALDVFDEQLSKAEEASAADSEEMTERQKEIKSGLLNNLAWVLGTSPDDDLRDGERAVELATEASELTDYKAAFILSTLASGYAEKGDFKNARKWAAKAVELAESEEQREGLQDELDSYKRNEPWREREDVEGEQKEKDKSEEKSNDEDEKSSDDSEADGSQSKKSDSDKKQSDKSDEDKSEKENSDDDKKDDDDDDAVIGSIQRLLIRV